MQASRDFDNAMKTTAPLTREIEQLRAERDILTQKYHIVLKQLEVQPYDSHRRGGVFYSAVQDCAPLVTRDLEFTTSQSDSASLLAAGC